MLHVYDVAFSQTQIESVNQYAFLYFVVMNFHSIGRRLWIRKEGSSWMGSECGMYCGNIRIQGGIARVLATKSAYMCTHLNS